MVIKPYRSFLVRLYTAASEACLGGIDTMIHRGWRSALMGVCLTTFILGLAQADPIPDEPSLVLQRIQLSNEFVEDLHFTDPPTGGSENLTAVLFLRNNTDDALTPSYNVVSSESAFLQVQNVEPTQVPANTVTPVTVTFNRPNLQRNTQGVIEPQTYRGILTIRPNNDSGVVEVVDSSYTVSPPPTSTFSLGELLAILGLAIAAIGFTAMTTNETNETKVRLMFNDDSSQASEAASYTGLFTGVTNTGLAAFLITSLEVKGALVIASVLFAVLIILAPILYKAIAAWKEGSVRPEVYYGANFIALLGIFSQAFILFHVLQIVDFQAIFGADVRMIVAWGTLILYVTIVLMYSVATMRRYLEKHGDDAKGDTGTVAYISEYRAKREGDDAEGNAEGNAEPQRNLDVIIPLPPRTQRRFFYL